MLTPGGTVPLRQNSVYPFVALQMLGLALCIVFPQTVLWLPRIAGLLV